jgi:hypothetical protein
VKALITFTFISLISFSAFAENSIYVEQTEDDNLNLKIHQEGDKNIVDMYDTSSYIEGIDMHLHQHNVLNNSLTNKIELWHIDSGNSIKWGQGAATCITCTSFTTDVNDDDIGGQYALIDIHGTGNNIAGTQMNAGDGSHSSQLYIWSDNNDIVIKQKNDNDKSLVLYTFNDDNDVSITQRNSATHSATISLDGSHGTSLSLTQRGNTSQSYSLSQNCQTNGGCSVSVTQGN